MRQGRPGVRGKFVQVEPRMSQTGASADEWVPVKPGTEGVLALGLAHVILASKLRPGRCGGRAGALIDGWSGGLADYTPAQGGEAHRRRRRRIERLAREFAEQQPAVAIIGGAPLAQTNGLFHALAVNALNALLGSVGQPGGIFFTPGASGLERPERRKSPARSAAVGAGAAARRRQSRVRAPKAWKVREALAKIPFIVSFGSFVDDTSASPT